MQLSLLLPVIILFAGITFGCSKPETPLPVKQARTVSPPQSPNPPLSDDEVLVEAAESIDLACVESVLVRTPSSTAKTEALFAIAKNSVLMFEEIPTRDGKTQRSGAGSGQLNDVFGEIAQALIEHGATIDARDQSGATPVIWAARDGRTSVVRVLLKNGASVDAKDKAGETALIAAACQCPSIDMPDTVDSMRLLLGNGANVNAKDKQGATALMAAASTGRPDNAKLLLDRGATVDARNNTGETALLISARAGPYSSVGAVYSTDIVKLLLARGADIEARDQNGDTALMLASSTGGGYEPTKVVKQLLHSGADPRATNKNGQTALALAVKNHRSEIALLLKEAMADARSLDSWPRDPNAGSRKSLRPVARNDGVCFELKIPSDIDHKR